MQKISDCLSQDVHSLQLPSKEEQLTCPLCRLFFPTMARLYSPNPRQLLHQNHFMFRNDFQGVIVFFCQNGPAPGDGAQVCLQRNRLRLQLCQQVSVTTEKGAIHFYLMFRRQVQVGRARKSASQEAPGYKSEQCVSNLFSGKGLLQKMKYKYISRVSRGLRI